jgi:hypothetical protein
MKNYFIVLIKENRKKLFIFVLSMSMGVIGFMGTSWLIKSDLSEGDITIPQRFALIQKSLNNIEERLIHIEERLLKDYDKNR